jgi:hypothetical protein
MIKKCEKASRAYQIWDYFLHDSEKNIGYQFYERGKTLIIHRYQIECARRIYEKFALKMLFSDFSAIMKRMIDEDMKEKEERYSDRHYIRRTCDELYKEFVNFEIK